MTAGKLALLLIVGGLAGAAFASLSTGSLRSYTQGSPSAPASALAQQEAPTGRSWLDEGLTVLQSPAWPFGEREWNPDPPRQAGDYPAPEYGAPGRWEDEDQGGERYREVEPWPQDELGAAVQDAEPLEPPMDPRDAAAAEAARRAQDTARDVLAAEHGS
ncbi:hypothetical protein [Novosphingobium soli]|uniref:Uncharacterized protein n=1 Tax=Novosphingobium soli TaxID=574956 RepID=A0ABV6CZV1_9SPHN